MTFLKALGITGAAFAAIIVGFIAAYPLLYPTYSHRYRLTLEVETPDGLRSGSSVIEPSARGQPPILVNSTAVTGLKGNAVFVDLGIGKNLIGLLTLGDKAQDVDGAVRLAIKAFEIPNCGAPFCQWKQIAKASGVRKLPPELYPTLATVGDVTDPQSTRLLTPDDFEAAFGPGYQFKRAWIELTDDPVSSGIERKLPFLQTHKRELAKFRVEKAGNPFVPRLGHFQAGGN